METYYQEKFFYHVQVSLELNMNKIPLILISDSKRLASVNKDLKSISFHSKNENPLNILLFKKLDMNKIKILNLIERKYIVSQNF